MNNRFALWPLLPGAAITVFFCWLMRSDAIGVEVMAQGMLLVLYGPWLVAAFCVPLFIALWQTVITLRSKRWRRAASMLACPLLILVSIPIAALYDHACDLLEYYRRSPAFERRISEAKADGQHKTSIALSLLHNAERTMTWDDRYIPGAPRDSQPQGWQHDYQTCKIIPVKDQIFVAECGL